MGVSTSIRGTKVLPQRSGGGGGCMPPHPQPVVIAGRDDSPSFKQWSAIMTRPVLFAVLAATSFAAVPAMLVTPAQAQIEVQIGTAPPSNGSSSDRDRDGVPN